MNKSNHERTTTIKNNLFIILVFLILNLGFCSAFASESVLSSHGALPENDNSNSDQTPWVTDYLDKLRTNCKFNVDEFEKIRDAASSLNPTIANPMSENRSLLSIFSKFN